MSESHSPTQSSENLQISDLQNPNPNCEIPENDPDQKSEHTTEEIGNPLPKSKFEGAQKTADKKMDSVEQKSSLLIDVDEEQVQELGQKKQLNDDDDEEEVEDEEGISMPHSPLPQSVNAKSSKVSDFTVRRNSKRKKGLGNKAANVRKKRFEALFDIFKPIPFMPVKKVDFSKYEKNLKRLGLWDFAHVEFDSNLRVDLLVQLVSDYKQKDRCSYVNEWRINVTRADLARALKLPVKKITGNAEGEVFSREFISFLEDFVSNWMLLQDSDVWVTPTEIVNWMNLIREGQLQKIDWAGMIWFMVEKELSQGIRLRDCYFASHLQQLIKDQKGHLLTESKHSGVDKPKVEEVNVEDDEDDRDTEMLDARQPSFEEEKTQDKKCVAEVKTVGASDVVEKELFSGMAQKDNDADLTLKDGNADMAPKDGNADMAVKDSGAADMALKDGDTDIALKDGDSDMALKDDDADMALKDDDADMALKDDDADLAPKDDDADLALKDDDADLALKDGDADLALKDGDADMALKDSDADMARNDMDADMGKKNGDADMEERADNVILPEMDGEASELKKVDDIDEERNVESMGCVDKAEEMENIDNVEFAEDLENAKEINTDDMVEFALERDWLMNGLNDGDQHIMQRCSMAGQREQKMPTEDTRPDVGEDVEDEVGEDDKQGFNFMDKSPLDVMSSRNLMQAVETEHLSYASAELGGQSSLGLMPSRDDNDVMLNGASMFNNVGKREVDHDHDFSHHSLSDNHKRMRMADHWNSDPPDYAMCLAKAYEWMEKSKMAVETEKYQQANALQMYTLQLEEKESEIMQWRIKFEELQRKSYSEVSRRDRELHLMNSVIEGYRRALTDTHRAFSDYRKRCQIPDEPIYKDVGSGGVVKSTMELERDRIKQEEERKKMEYLLQETFNVQINEYESQWEDLHIKVMFLDERLSVASKEVEQLKDCFVKHKMSTNVALSQEVQSEAQDVVKDDSVEHKLLEDVVMSEESPSETQEVVKDDTVELKLSEDVMPAEV